MLIINIIFFGLIFCKMAASNEVVEIAEIPTFLEYLSVEIQKVDISEFEEFKAKIQSMNAEYFHMQIGRLVRRLFLNTTLKMSRAGKESVSNLQRTALTDYVKVAIARLKKIIVLDNMVSKYYIKNVLLHHIGIECAFRLHKIVHNYLWYILYKSAIDCVTLEHNTAENFVQLLVSRKSILYNNLDRFLKKNIILNDSYCRHFDAISVQSNVNIIIAVVENNCKL